MAGAGYKLFNTGDVLTAAQVNTYLMEQTVMVFADAAARTAALSGVVSEGMISYLKDTNAVEVYNGSAWVASDDPNAIQNTIVDAKGDLITATAADTPARLAVGNNGETLVADSSASTGLRYNPQNALVNPVINGGMDVWQRGTSLSLTASNANTYLADRWGTFTGTNQACTISRQATGDTTNLANIQYALRYQRNSGQTGTGNLDLTQSFETTNSIPFAGKTVTLSFYARAGANYSATSSALTVFLISGTGTDQSRISASYTGEAYPISAQVATLTTTWQRFAFTGTVAATATELATLFRFSPTGTASTNDWYEITGVQIDIGTYTASTAPTFRRAGGTLAGELAACQRYYWRFANSGNSPYDTIANGGIATSTTSAFFSVQCPVPMRTTPSSMDYSTTYSDYAVSDASAMNAASAINFDSGAASPNYGTFSVTSTGLTQWRPYVLRAQVSGTPNVYIGFSAEL